MPSGITKCAVPFGVPALSVSLGSRANITSTPMCFWPLPRGEPKPSEIVGARPFHCGTGHTQRPAIGALGAAFAAGADS